MEGMEIRRISRGLAEEACRRWHYSGRIPANMASMGRYGVFINNEFFGCVTLGYCVGPWAYKIFGLENTKGLFELTRMAFKEHAGYHISHFVAPIIRMMRMDFPNVRVLVSYADPNEGHTGLVYRAMSWVYLGTTTTRYRDEYVIDGEVVSEKTVWHRHGTFQVSKLLKMGLDVETRRLLPKHKFAKGLTRKYRKVVAGLGQVYEETGVTPTYRVLMERENGQAVQGVA